MEWMPAGKLADMVLGIAINRLTKNDTIRPFFILLFIQFGHKITQKYGNTFNLRVKMCYMVLQARHSQLGTEVTSTFFFHF